MSHPRCHYMQTSYWGKVTSELPWLGILRWDGNGKIRGSVALQLYPMRGTKLHLLYAPRGPICDWADEETFAELMRGVRAMAEEYHGYLFRMDPAVPTGDAAARAMIQKHGFRITPVDDFSAFQARMVYQIDIGGRGRDEVMAAFTQKARYNVRLAGKKGVEARICGAEALPEFCAMMKATAAHDHFTPKSQDYFERFLAAMGEYGRLYMAYIEDIPVSGAIAVQMGGKTWYAYGCSDEHHRNLMGSYLNQWEIISWAVDGGCHLYDLRGVEGYPTEGNPKLGLHRFKQGFGSHFVEFMGQMDLPLRQDWKLITGAQELYKRIRK